MLQESPDKFINIIGLKTEFNFTIICAINLININLNKFKKTNLIYSFLACFDRIIIATIYLPGSPSPKDRGRQLQARGIFPGFV